MNTKAHSKSVASITKYFSFSFLMFSIFIYVFLTCKNSVSAEVIVDEYPIFKTYSDLTNSERKAQTSEKAFEDHNGCSANIFYILNPVVKELGRANEAGKYGTHAAKAYRYFKTVSDTLYPEQNQGWYCTGLGEDENGVYAYVDYDGRASAVSVPKLTHYDGKSYPVRGLSLVNQYAVIVIVPDEIEYIARCSGYRINLVKGCAGVREIGSNAFSQCCQLNKLPLMPKLERIDSHAFYGCFRLKDILLGDNIEFISMEAFGWYDAVLGNYDWDNKLEDDVSWEECLRDEDRIYGITLYANKGSTTYWTMENLYKFHYAEVQNNYTDDETHVFSEDYVDFWCGHINYQYSDNYIDPEDEYEIVWLPVTPTPDISWPTPPNLPPMDDPLKDPEPIEEPEKEKEEGLIDYLIKLLDEGTLTFAMLMTLFMSMFTFAGPLPNYIKERLSSSAISAIQSQMIQYRDMDDKQKIEYAKAYMEYAITVADNIPMSKAYGYIMKTEKAFNKMAELMEQGEDMSDAFNKAVISMGLPELAGLVTNSVPVIGIWDTTVTVLFGNSTAKDATNIGDNVEHLADLIYDVITLDTNCTTAGSTIEERMLSGVYGENLKNCRALYDITENHDWVYVAKGIKEMGVYNFLVNICNTAESVTTENSVITRGLLDMFNKYVQDLTVKGIF